MAEAGRTSVVRVIKGATDAQVAGYIGDVDSRSADAVAAIAQGIVDLLTAGDVGAATPFQVTTAIGNAITALGLGTASTHQASDFATPTSLSTAISNAITALGLGTASTHPASDFATPSSVTSAVAGEAAARQNAITAAINALINGAPGLLDTLAEIDAQMANDESVAAVLTTLVNSLRSISDATFQTALRAFLLALDADPASALRVQQDTRQSSTFASLIAARWSVNQGPLYVDPTYGNDANDGLSSGKAKATAQTALNAIQAAGGGVLDLAAGTYLESLLIDSSATLRSDITIQGQQNRTILSPGSGQHGIHVKSSGANSARRITIDGVMVNGLSGSLDGINFGDGSWEQIGHLTVRRFSVANMGRDGIRIFNINNGHFEDGDISACGGRAIRATNNPSDGIATALGSVTLTASTDAVGKTAHGLISGQGVVLSGLSGGAGLTAGTVYFVKTVIDANNFTLATSAGGTLVDITTDGTATATVYPKPQSGNTVKFDVVSTSNCALGGILLDSVGVNYTWTGGEQNLAPVGTAAIEIIGAGSTGAITFRGVHMERNDVAAKLGDGNALHAVSNIVFDTCYSNSAITTGTGNFILNRVSRVKFKNIVGSSPTGVPLIDSLNASDQFTFEDCTNGAQPIVRYAA